MTRAPAPATATASLRALAIGTTSARRLPIHRPESIIATPMGHRCHGAPATMDSPAVSSFASSDTTPETTNSGCSVGAKVRWGHRLACAYTVMAGPAMPAMVFIAPPAAPAAIA